MKLPSSLVRRNSPHVLFSVMPNDVGLYGKPMARNVQLWTRDCQPLLDGPHASRCEIERAAHAVAEGGLFGYRFQFPAMRVGRYEVYWHRPLVAYLSAETGQPTILDDAPLGYLTAYHLKEKRRSRAGCAAVLEHSVELWPRMLRREPHLAAIELFDHKHNHHPYLTALNVRKLLDTRRLMDGRPLPRSFCRSMLTLPKHETLDSWLENLPKHANDAERCQNLVEELHGSLEPDHPPSTGNSRVGAAPSPLTTHHSPLTFHHTARRSFEVAYWKNIAELAEGRYLNKNNADCVYDPVTRCCAITHAAICTLWAITCSPTTTASLRLPA